MRRKTTSSKKAQERSYLERFRELWPSFPAGTLSDDRESPDFTIDAADGKIGIEVTKLYHSAAEGRRPLQEQENLRMQAVECAQSLYESTQSIPVIVSVGFYPRLELSKSTVPQIAEDIARLVDEYMPESDGLIQVKPQIECRGKYSAHIRVITLQRFTGLSRNAWNPTGSAWIPECTPDLVQATVDGKNAKYESYAQECSEVWLLVTFDVSGLSSTFDIPSETLSHSYYSKFERVFLMNFALKTVHQLHKV